MVKRGWFKESHRHFLAAKGISTNRYMARGGAAERRKKFLNLPTREVPYQIPVKRSTPVLTEPAPGKKVSGAIGSGAAGVEKQLVGFALLEMKNEKVKELMRTEGLTLNEAKLEAQKWYEAYRSDYAAMDALRKAAEAKQDVATRQEMNLKLVNAKLQLETALASNDEAAIDAAIKNVSQVYAEDREARSLRKERAEEFRESRALKQEIQELLESKSRENYFRVAPEGGIKGSSRDELRVPSNNPIREKALERLEREQEGIESYDERMRRHAEVKESAAVEEAKQDALAKIYTENRIKQLLEGGNLSVDRLRAMFRSEDEDERARATSYLNRIESAAAKEAAKKFERRGKEEFDVEKFFPQVVSTGPVQPLSEETKARHARKNENTIYRRDEEGREIGYKSRGIGDDILGGSGNGE